MSAGWFTPDWDFEGIEHGFAPKDTQVAEHLCLARVKQVHGAELLVADGSSPTPDDEADGLVTATPGVAVAIATADCVPVLLAAPDAKIVAAVHAGWRGSLAGIAPAAVAMFADRFAVAASDVHAALGPSIGGCCYEIERDIAARFADEFGSEMWSAWTARTSVKGTLDLRVVNEVLLLRAGIPPSSVHHVGPCTSCGDGDLASYRVSGGRAGRQLSWIGLTA